MAETIHVRGEGGAIIPMDLPLPEPIADRVAAGQLVRVNPDGTPYIGTGAATAPASAPERPALGEDGRSDLTAGRVPRPPQSAPKSDWIDHIALRGLRSREDAEAMTKADLIELSEES